MTLFPTEAPTTETGQPPVLNLTTQNTASWLSDNATAVRDLVREHGVLVLRAPSLASEDGLHQAAMALSAGLFSEQEAIASRDQFDSGVYSPSAWPAQQQMCMHHELSYRTEFPGLMAFACVQEAASGGEIATADGARMLEVLPPELVDRVEREGWILARSYSDDIGLSVEEAFGTTDRGTIEAYCQQNMIRFQWGADGGLRTRQRRPGVVHHQDTGQRIWFNQLAFLSEWTLVPAVRDFLIDEYGADALPFTTFFGNGEPLTSDVVTTINDAYDSITVSAPMQRGDLTLVDNVRTAHGRGPFEGDRNVLVALCEGVKISDLRPR